MFTSFTRPESGSAIIADGGAIFSEAERAFDEEVREFCLARQDDIAGDQFFAGRGPSTRSLYRSLGARGWLSLSWPVGDGGQASGVCYDFLLWNQMAYFRYSRPDFGPGIIAHVLIEHGTSEQKRTLLPKIADGSICFVLGYSEPEAGSDLTGLRTRAQRDHDGYVINGEKCWTSDAHHADYIWLLARTGSLEDRGRGLSLFVVDVRDVDGLEIRPIHTIDGHRLNQMIFTDVRIPAEARVGPENAAWEIMRAALAVERHIQLLPGRPERELQDLVAFAYRDGAPVAEVRAELTRLSARFYQVQAAALSTVAKLEAGQDAAVDAARTRLIGGRLTQDIARTALRIYGAPVLEEPEQFQFLWRQSIMETIAGGTSEVLQGIIARQALRLGRSG